MADRSPPDDEPKLPQKVGYKNPPKHSQFKPNGPGGPGRPKGSKNLKNLFQKHASAKVTIKVDGRSVTLSAGEATLIRVLREGIAGKPRAMAQVLNLIEMYGLGDEAPPIQFDYEALTPEEFFVFARLQKKLLGKEEEWAAFEAESLAKSNEDARRLGYPTKSDEEHEREKANDFARVLADSRERVEQYRPGSSPEEEELVRTNKLRAEQGLSPLQLEDLNNPPDFDDPDGENEDEEEE